MNTYDSMDTLQYDLLYSLHKEKSLQNQAHAWKSIKVNLVIQALLNEK